MMNRLRLAPLFLFASFALAQPTPVTPDTMWTGADGKYESAPDTALVQFSISVQQPKVQDAYTQAKESAEKIRQTLHANGLDPKDAQIGSFAMTPAYQWNPKRKLVGFQVNSNVIIKVHDFEKLGALTDTFSQLESDEGITISYTLDKMDAAKAKAVEDAYRRARMNAEALAHAAGRSLGAMSYASVDANEFVPQPRPMMMRAQNMAKAAPSPMEDFAPAKITVTAHVNVLFQLK
jgi:uncharacterized protein YggE